MTQYTVINDSNAILYLNSMQIPLQPGDKRWFYFESFDIRYILSAVGFLTISHKYDKLHIEGDGQLTYEVEHDGKTVHIKSKPCSNDKECCKNCKWYNKGIKNMVYCAVNPDISNTNPKETKCEKYFNC